MPIFLWDIWEFGFPQIAHDVKSGVPGAIFSLCTEMLELVLETKPGMACEHGF
jgi:hypothetical protein